MLTLQEPPFITPQTPPSNLFSPPIHAPQNDQRFLLLFSRNLQLITINNIRSFHHLGYLLCVIIHTQFDYNDFDSPASVIAQRISMWLQNKKEKELEKLSREIVEEF
jgi:hypothetical protein